MNGLDVGVMRDMPIPQVLTGLFEIEIKKDELPEIEKRFGRTFNAVPDTETEDAVKVYMMWNEAKDYMEDE